MQTEAKVSILVAIIMILLAFYNLRLAAGLAVIYLLVYGVRRMRKAM